MGKKRMNVFEVGGGRETIQNVKKNRPKSIKLGPVSKSKHMIGCVWSAIKI